MSVKKMLCWVLMLSMVFVSGCGVLNWIFPDNNDEPPEDDDDYMELPGDNDDEGTTGSGNERETVLWVIDPQGRYLVPVTYKMPVQDDGVGRAALNHLVEGGPGQQFLTTQGLKGVLPSGTQVLGMTVKEDESLAIVDFNREFMNTVDASQERLIIDAVVHTLTEFYTIDKVTIWVEGNPITRMNHGTPVEQEMTREQGVNSTGSPKGTGAAVTVYMRMDNLAGGTYLVPITHPVSAVSDKPRAALERLIGGPQDMSGLSAVMPASTLIRNLTIEGNTAIVDFSADMAEGDTELNVAVAAVVLTLTELSEISNVQITIAGQSIEMPDGRTLSEPVTRPSSTNPLAF